MLKLHSLLEAGNVVKANEHILKAYAGGSNPCEWFSPATDDLVAPLIKLSILHLYQKPLGTWAKTEFYFPNRLLTLTCGVAYTEKNAGMNESAQRWLKLFVGCLESVPLSSYPLLLWLFTFDSVRDTYLGPELGALEVAYVNKGFNPMHVRKQRDHSLYRFGKDLYKLDPQCGSDFVHRLSLAIGIPRFCYSCLWRSLFVFFGLGG